MTTSTLDPGRTAPQRPPYEGDQAAAQIRAALERVKALAAAR